MKTTQVRMTMFHPFKINILAGAAVLAMALPATGHADDVKIGILGGLTGPIESLVPPIIASSKLAGVHINEQGGILGGQKIVTPVGDTTCADATAAANAADRLVNSENVLAISGALCSGATISAANNAAIPGNVVVISPASTSPAISEMDDNDLVYRVAPSDAYQGEVMARLLMSKGLDEIALAYVNNDYGKGLADAIEANFKIQGGTVAAKEAHEEGKADYRGEVGSLASSGAPTLVIVAYGDGSGQTLLRQAIEAGDFEQLVGAEGMLAVGIIENIEAADLEGMIVTKVGNPAVPGKDVFEPLAKAAGLDVSAPFVTQGYDSVFLLALAIEKNGKAERAGLSKALRAISSPPGETVFPGEWEKALHLLKDGQDINYEGASGSHDFDDKGDVPGAIIEMVIKGGKFVEVGEFK